MAKVEKVEARRREEPRQEPQKPQTKSRNLNRILPLQTDLVPDFFNQEYSTGENSIYEKRDPAKLYEYKRIDRPVFGGGWFTPEIGMAMVVREDGKITQTLRSGEYKAKSLVDTELYEVYMGGINHQLMFPIGVDPDDVGSTLGIDFSYWVSDPVKCVECKSLEPGCLSSIIIRSANQLVREHQIGSKKKLMDLGNSDSQQIQGRLREKLSRNFSSWGYTFGEINLGIKIPESVAKKRLMMRQLGEFNELLGAKNKIEEQQAEIKRKEIEQDARNELLIARLRSEEYLRLQREELKIKLEALVAARNANQGLEKAILENDDPLIKGVAAYSYLSDLTEYLIGSSGSGNNDRLLEEVLGSVLRMRETPPDVRKVEAIGKGLEGADIRVGQGPFEIYKGLMEIYKKSLGEKNEGKKE